MPPLVADRARKARKASKLACGCYILTGHLIARVGGRWVCIEHCLAAREGAPMVYDQMIKRDDEDGPDPLVPEPSVPRLTERPLGIPKLGKKRGKPAKSAKKGAKHGKS